MNKTLMLVICDFLLLSMLALARFDPPEDLPVTTLDATASSATAEAELISLLEESLESELESRSDLNEDLDDTRQDLEEKARSLAEREAALADTQKSLQLKVAEAAQLAAAKATIETEQAKLTIEKAQVEADRQALALKFETTRTELESAQTERIELTQTLGQLKKETSVSKERLSQAEKDLIAREVALAQREAELKAAQAEARKLNKEREALSQQLKVAQAERTLLEQNLSNQQQANQQLQVEKAQALAHADRLTENVSELGAGVSQLGQGVSELGQGVTELAQSSEEIIKEMDASRPRTMSEIFTRFQNNRATIHFTSSEKPRIGSPNTHHYESKSILISDTTGTYLVTHTADTPFAFFKNPDSILSVQLEVTLAGRTLPVNQIAFLSADPRLIYIPLPKGIAEASGLETFELALQPERWEEAVLVKNDESNFGRTGFRRLTSSERFLKMDRPTLGELFTDFASSRGDLAFTKNSQFIGVLTDSKHAVVIDAFLASGIGNLGPSFNKTESAATIRRLKDRVRKLPSEVR
jgi:uncharacterized protein YoxC